MKRRNMSRKSSGKNFKRGTRVNKKNLSPRAPLRGGYRL